MQHGRTTSADNRNQKTESHSVGLGVVAAVQQQSSRLRYVVSYLLFLSD